MSKSLVRFQSQHTRNSHTWNYKRLSNGRLGLIQHGGVAATAGYLVKALVKAGRAGLSAKELVAYLQENVDRSYGPTDLSAPIKKLFEVDAIQKNGMGPGSTYHLTVGGLAKWRNVKACFR